MVRAGADLSRAARLSCSGAAPAVDSRPGPGRWPTARAGSARPAAGLTRRLRSLPPRRLPMSARAIRLGRLLRCAGQRTAGVVAVGLGGLGGLGHDGVLLEGTRDQRAANGAPDVVWEDPIGAHCHVDPPVGPEGKAQVRAARRHPPFGGGRAARRRLHAGGRRRRRRSPAASWCEAIADAHFVGIRSRTQLTAAVLDAGRRSSRRSARSASAPTRSTCARRCCAACRCSTRRSPTRAASPSWCSPRSSC